MPLKHAVLGLLAERPDYGYDLARRFEARVGPGWRLQPSAIYPALDQLERAGLVTGSARSSGTHRSPRVVYASTRAGAAALDAWLRAGARPEPVRSELHLKLAFARAEHRAALAHQLAAEARACERLLARCLDAHASSRGAGGGWPATAHTLLDAAVVTRLRADLAWLEEARVALTGGEG